MKVTVQIDIARTDADVDWSYVSVKELLDKADSFMEDNLPEGFTLQTSIIDVLGPES